MNNHNYEKLAEALDRLPGGFPRTKSGVELRILRKIFSPEEAQVAGHMTGSGETADVIAGRAGLPLEQVEKTLKAMLSKDIIWGVQRESGAKYRLAPYIVGFYESQWKCIDEEFARLHEQYWNEGGVEGIMRPQPSLHRVVPAQQAIKSEFILPYDDIKSMLLKAKWFNLIDCICRKQQDVLGKRKCDFPVRTCLVFSTTERAPGSHTISQAEALKLLDEVEDIGLVHTVSNVARGVFYVCNCCGCCCGLLRGITEFGIADSVAKANYLAVLDSDACNGCGTCAERCQVGACTVDDVAQVDKEKCIGCGLCVTGCPSGAMKLERRPDSAIIPPPEDYKTWEQQRLRNRGLL